MTVVLSDDHQTLRSAVAGARRHRLSVRGGRAFPGSGHVHNASIGVPKMGRSPLSRIHRTPSSRVYPAIVAAGSTCIQHMQKTLTQITSQSETPV
jgi:hypothetical protein